MQYKRTIKFRYYQIKKQEYNIKQEKWNPIETFDFIKWISVIKSRNLLKTDLEFSNCLARIEECNYHRENDLWCLRFMKLRDTNIPSKVKRGADAEPIELDDDEYIGEDLTMLYEKCSGIAMIQINRFSLGIKKIEEFIEHTLNDSKIKIIISPIIDIFDNDIITKGSCRNLEISFANLDTWNPDSKKIALGTLMNPLKRMGGYVGKVSVGLGYVKKDSLDKTVVKQIIEEIEGKDKYVTSVKIKIKDDDDNQIDVIDLFDQIACDYITFALQSRETLKYKTAVMEMISCYKKRRGKLYKLISYVSE